MKRLAKTTPYAFLLLSLFLFSCNRSTSEVESGPMLDEYSIIEERTIELDVGDTITHVVISFEYLDKTAYGLEEDLIVAHDLPSGSLNFFSVGTKQLIKKLKLETEGPHAIGPSLSGFHVKSMDSIFIAGSYFISLVNRGGKPYFQHNLGQDADGRPALPQINNGASIAQYDGKIYMNTAPDISTLEPRSFGGKQALKILDLESKQVTTELEYPEPYRKGAFGPNYASFYQAFNPVSLDLVFSFPADHHLYVAKVNDLEDVRHYWGGSKHIPSINPMDRQYPDNDDYEYYSRYFVQNPSYGHIYYDKYRELYYRVAYRPVTEHRYAERVRWKPKSLIVFDKDFRRRGEVELPEDTNPSGIEPIKDGVLIHSGGGDEDKLRFTLFKIVKKRD